MIIMPMMKQRTKHTQKLVLLAGSRMLLYFSTREGPGQEFDFHLFRKTLLTIRKSDEITIDGWWSSSFSSLLIIRISRCKSPRKVEDFNRPLIIITIYERESEKKDEKGAFRSFEKLFLWPEPGWAHDCFLTSFWMLGLSEPSLRFAEIIQINWPSEAKSEKNGSPSLRKRQSCPTSIASNYS